MKPFIVQIVFYRPDLAIGGNIPQTQAAVVFADDEFQALKRILPGFMEEYGMTDATFSGGELGEAFAYGAAPDGSEFTAEAFDSARQPSLFVEIMKDMQYAIDAPFADSFMTWAHEHSHEAFHLLATLDEVVGDVFVNEVDALAAMRPVVIAWRERAKLIDAAQPGHGHNPSRSL